MHNAQKPAPAVALNLLEEHLGRAEVICVLENFDEAVLALRVAAPPGAASTFLDVAGHTAEALLQTARQRVHERLGEAGFEWVVDASASSDAAVQQYPRRLLPGPS
jgi:hypothetical protein